VTQDIGELNQKEAAPNAKHVEIQASAAKILPIPLLGDPDPHSNKKCACSHHYAESPDDYYEFQEFHRCLQDGRGRTALHFNEGLLKPLVYNVKFLLMII